MSKLVLRIAAAAVLLLALPPCATVAAAQTATAVPQLDLNRFMGTWYEVARYPIKPEKSCVADAMVLYALADKSTHFQVVDSCRTKDGSMNVRNANGKTSDKSGDGKLKVGSFFLFYKKYWVLAIGPDNDWALVGAPNHKTLWILSRTPVIKPENLALAESKAAAEGFPNAKLIPRTQPH
jgi:apolipoprotein D and lipocalin family protein